MTYDPSDYALHTMAVMATRKAYGLEPLPEFASQEEQCAWLDAGPHLVREARSYYVHAMGVLQSGLGQAITDHPDWHLIAVLVRGNSAEVHNTDLTLGELGNRVEGASQDTVRLAYELTSRERRVMWGVGMNRPPKKANDE